MRPRALVAALALASLVGFVSAGSADDAGAQRAKALKDAFKPLRLPPPARLEKDVVAVLPGGIVIESKPFDDLIARFGKPFEDALVRRAEILGTLRGSATKAEAEAIKASWKTLEDECHELTDRVAAIEQRYAEVFNLEWDASGVGERQTRQLTAVLVPLYRRLLLREAAVAAAAGEALAGTKDAAAFAGVVALASDPSPGLRSVAVEALARTGGPEALAALRKVASADPEPALRTRALGGICRWPIAEGKDAYEAALRDAAWEVRALAIEICVRARLLASAPALIAALETEDGRLRHDLDEALHALLGPRMYGDASLWKAWWKDNAERVEGDAKKLESEGAYAKPLGPPEEWEDRPAEDAPKGDAKDDAGRTAEFYGIPTHSKRVLFVVDISKSMEDAASAHPPAQGGEKDPYAAPKGQSKIAIAKWQLHRAIAALPADAVFGLIVYSESYRVWQPRMTEATPKGKAKAHEFVDSIKVNGTTNIADSLDEAFELAGVLPVPLGAKAPRPALAADTIYLLSDGDPNRGRITDLPALLEDMVRRNRSTRLVIHAIGIGEVAGSEFLRSLATRNGGRYVGF